MKEHSPKPDLWSKIQQQKDFESQVKAHASNLPQRMPRTDLWNAIEKELDQKKPVVPLWKYVSIAASLAFILMLSGLAYWQSVDNKTDEQLISELVVPAEETLKSENNSPVQSEPSKEVIINSDSQAPKQEIPIPTKPKINREYTEPLELPAIERTGLTLENTFFSELIIPPKQEAIAQETFHKVQISWGLKEKIKVRTQFGKSETDPLLNQQVSRVEPSKNSIKIKFQK
ncbi:hypothetical protein [Algoriphagus machipongonensis]|uniref:Uncharacterized protein n=1 Tax=Algoriphagus machipongonensis TaxID=388413 RepID=A3HYD8_9BACT|nr:hypothetical protein [Algoriphagus machipongonensis]EAZ80274.1 hypothetical protein ALPR1_05110 [Algoriphagus machipongonensis]